MRDCSLDVAKRIVTAARKEEMGCRSYRRASWEAAQSMVREEVAQIKGCLIKKEVTESEEVAHSLSEEVTQEKNIHPCTHTSVHSFNHWLSDVSARYIIHSFHFVSFRFVSFHCWVLAPVLQGFHGVPYRVPWRNYAQVLAAPPVLRLRAAWRTPLRAALRGGEKSGTFGSASQNDKNGRRHGTSQRLRCPILCRAYDN